MRRILGSLPASVELVVVAKNRTAGEIISAIECGACIIGENYVQEAELMRACIASNVAWHCIGHLQKNKVKKAVVLFDMIETVDSLDLAEEIDKRCAPLGKIMPVLIEVNSGQEPNKSGAMPEDVPALAASIAALKNIKLNGLMTMGPVVDNVEEIRPYFAQTYQLFLKLKQLDIPGVEITCLSMGMTESYRIAIEEGATMVRIGQGIFSVYQ